MSGTGCAAGSFGYLGQPLTFSVAPVITVTALSADGLTATQNHAGSFLKRTNSTLAGHGNSPTPASPALDVLGLPTTTADPAIADLGAGRANLTFSAGSGIKWRAAVLSRRPAPKSCSRSMSATATAARPRIR